MTQRVAFVTGAMGGLGTAICQAYAKDGYKVVAAYHPQFDNRDEWLKEMEAAGFKGFVCVAGDVSSLEDCQKMAAEAEANAGPIDILVNNAGITRDRMFAKMDKDQWDAVISTNLTSLFNMTKQVSAKMTERGWGRIINISSVNGVKGQAGQSNYSAAKAGVIGLTKAAAKDLGKFGITCNSVAPGFILTEMGEGMPAEFRDAAINESAVKRAGKPEDVAWLVAFLASECGRHITGEVIKVDGGQYI